MIVMFTYLATPVQAADAYPYRNGSWLKADSWGFYQREWTSYACWKVRQAHGIDFNNSYRLSNGNRWGDAEIRTMLPEKSDLGSIIYQQEDVSLTVIPIPMAPENMDTLLMSTLSPEIKFMSGLQLGGTHKYGDRMLNKTAFSGYIHFEDLQHVFYVKYNTNGGKAAWQIPLLPMELEEN